MSDRPIRTSDYPVDPIFVARWSPRAFDRSAVPRSDLLTILEAARWAPSAFNLQPWRFVYALRQSDSWPGFLDVLTPWNRAWAENAGALVFVLSEPSRAGFKGGSATATFDAGAAWAHIALQAFRLGYHTHAMAGFDAERGAQELKTPERFRFEAAIALGRIAEAETLPEKLRAREFPSLRRALTELAFEGRWPARAD